MSPLRNAAHLHDRTVSSCHFSQSGLGWDVQLSRGFVAFLKARRYVGDKGIGSVSDRTLGWSLQTGLAVFVDLTHAFDLRGTSNHSGVRQFEAVRISRQ